MASYQAVNAVLQARYEESTVEQQAASQTVAVPQNEIDDSRASAKVVLAPENSGRGNNASSLRDDAVVKGAMRAYHVMQEALQGTCEYINLQYQTNPQAKVAIQAEVDDLRRRLNDADNEIRHHRANSTRICNELNDEHQDVVRANRKCLQLEAKWRSADQRIKNMEGAEDSLRSLNSELDKRLADAMDGKKTIEADYASAQEKLANAEEERVTLRSEVFNITERLASVSQSNETTEAKYLFTRKKLETSEASESALRTDNMKLRASLADAAESKRTIEANRDMAIMESEINRNHWIEAHTARTHVDSVNKFLERKIKQQDSDIKAMEQRNARLCEDLDSARSQTDAAQRDLRLRNDEVAVQRYRVSIAPDCHTIAWFNHGIDLTSNEDAYDIVCIMASQNETTKTAEREIVRMLTSSRDEADRLRREIRALEVAAVESDNATEEAEKHAKHLSQGMARLSIDVDQLRKEKDTLKVAAEESRKEMEDAQKANAHIMWRTIAQLGAKAHQVRRVGDPLSPNVRKIEKSTEATGNISVESLIEDLSKTLDDIADEMRTSKDGACRAEKNWKAAEDGRAEADKNYRRVQHRLEEVEQSLRTERNQLKIKLEQRIRDLTQNLNHSETKAQESEELAAAAEKSRTAAEHGRQEAESNCRRLQNQLAEVEQSLIDEKNQLQVTTKELGKANQKATQLENDMMKAQTQRNTLETVVEVSQGRLEELKGLRKQLRSHKKQHNAVKLDLSKAKVELYTLRDRVFHLEEASLDEQQRNTASREETQRANANLRIQLQRYNEVREEGRMKFTNSEEKARTAVEELEDCRAELQALQKALMEEKKEASKAAEELESCRAESLTLEKALAEEKGKATKREEEAVKLIEDLQASRSQVQMLKEAENVVASQENNMRSLEESQSFRSEVERRKSAVGQGNTNATTDIEQTNSESDDEVMVIEETEWIEARQGTKVKPVSKESGQQRSVPQATNKTSSNGNRTMPPPPTPTKYKSHMASPTSASDTSSESPSGASSVSQTESPSALRNPQAANTSSKASTPTKKRAASSDASKLSKDRIASTETTQSSKKRSAPPEAVVTDDENASEPQRPKRIRRPTLKMRPGDAET